MPTAAPVRRGAFLSYARSDGEAFARALQARLAADAPDVPVWLDRLETEGGVGWWRQIEAQLDRVEFLLIVMTPAALCSANTRQEWRSARQRGVCVYPVKGVPDTQLDYAALPRWMASAHFYDAEREWPSLLAHLRRGCVVSRVPSMAPPLPAAFVARPRETDALRALLLSADKGDPVAITAAVRGSGGFGKTTLATALCHDERVIEAYADGILWVTLGQSPRLLNELTKLYAALTGERPGFVDVDDAVRELALQLENRSCLLVIDDAWSAAHVAPLLRAATGCSCLITTRLLEVALDARRVDVDRMAETEALQLLAARSGIGEAETPGVGPLAARLGGWPLAIKLAGSVLRQRIAMGEGSARALEQVGRALDKRGATAFDADGQSGRSTVARSIEASLSMLPPPARQRCLELAIFPEDAAIPLGVGGLLWQLDELDAEDLSRQLDNLGLAEFDAQRGQLRLHDLLRAYLAAVLPDPAAAHARLVTAWGDPLHLPDRYAWAHYALHLRQSGRLDAWRALLLDADWLWARLAATDVHSMLTDFDALPGADRPLRLLRDALRLSAPALATDRAQLGMQLAGRLLAREEPEIVTLRGALRQRSAGARLELLHATLDAPGGLLSMTLVGHTDDVTALAFDPGGDRLLSASLDATLRLWDLRAGEPLARFEGHALGARAAVMCRGEAQALGGAGDGRLYLWAIEQRQLLRCFSSRRPAVRGLAVTPDGSVALSASREAGIIVWDPARGQRLCRLEGHLEPVNAVALSADGRRAVSGSDDGTVRVWDLAARRCERVLEGHAGPVNAVALSDDGGQVLSGGTDRTLRLWDAGAGECLRVLDGHDAAVTALAMCSMSGRAVSGSTDQTVRLWDLPAGRMLARLEAHSDAVRAVALQPGGQRAASGSADRTVKIWRFEDLAAPAPLPGHGAAVTSLVFSPDGRCCASGSVEGRVQVHEVDSGRLVRTIAAHQVPVRSLSFTPDSQCVISGGIDRTYWMWTVDSGERNWIPIRHQHAPSDYCAMSPSARFLAMASGDRCLYLWDLPSGMAVARYGTRRLFDPWIVPAPGRKGLPATDDWLDRYLPGETVYDVHIVRTSADGGRIVLSATMARRGGLRRDDAAGSACLLAFDVDTGEIQGLPLAQTSVVTAYALHRDGHHLLFAREDHALVWQDLRDDAAPPSLLPGHTEKVNAVAVASDGRIAYSCARDRTLRAWDLAQGRLLATLTVDAPLRTLALSADDRTLAVGDVAGRVHFVRLSGV